MKKLVIAHRGASGLVKFENTLDSFQKAIDLHCDAIECDVRKTSDDILVINHDERIDDLLIREHTYQELNNYTENKGYHFPTLIETLNLVKGKILIDIEIKEIGYEEKFLNEVLSILSINEFYVRSFYDKALVNIHKLNKEVRVILLTGMPKPKPYLKTRWSEVFPKRRLKRCNAIAVSPYYKEMILSYPKRLKKLGYPILVWTVNEKEDMEKYLPYVDGIVTNYPNILIDVLKEKGLDK